MPQPATARPWARIDRTGHWTTVNAGTPHKKPSTRKLTFLAHNITFNVDFQDPAGTGFNDPASGAGRRDLVRRVLTYIAETLDYPAGRVLDVDIEASVYDPGSGVLASGGTYFPTDEGPGFFNGMAFEHVNSGNDPAPGESDLYCYDVNWGYSFYVGSDSPAPDQYDLFSILLHELTHGLGLISLSDQDGNSAIGDPPSNPGIFSCWDRLLVSADTHENLWAEGGYFIRNPTFLVGSTSVVSFGGLAARQAFGDWPPVYTPPTFEVYSSLSHWPSGIAGGAVLEPSIGPGQTQRTYAPVEKGALADLGWHIWHDPTTNAAAPVWTKYE